MLLNKHFIAGFLIGFGSVIRLLAVAENADFDTKIKIPESLCTSGIYSIFRHPSYIGSLMIFAGVILGVGFSFEKTISYTFLMYLYLRSRAEREEKLLYDFPEFIDYKKETWGF
jgi:protein-S-isoprenylcysteine O-methyltransferase Ste14